MLDSFLNYLKHEKRYSHHTVLSYQNDLSQVQKFLSTVYQSGLNNAEYQMLRSWVIELMEHGLKPVSINRKIASVKAYYKHELRQGTLTNNPAIRLKPIKSEKRLPQFVGEMDMVRLLDQYPFSSDFSGVRDYMVLLILYGTGIRLSELLQLRDSDVNLAENNIKVLGKRNKERIIPLPHSIFKQIQEYWAKRNDHFESGSFERMLVTDRGEPCYPMFVYRLVKRHLTFCTTLEKKSPHVMRHTFATHLLNKGADLNAVKDLLGHAGLAATQIYTHNSLDKIKKIFNQAHPKA
jgi:integrase/recombinase XerC